MRRAAFLALATGLGVAPGSAGAQPVPEIGLPGGYFGDGPWTTWSGPWLALMERGDGFGLWEVAVTSTPHDEPGEPCEPFAGGVDYSVEFDASGFGELLILLRGFPGLREGPVITAFRGSRFLRPGESLDLPLGGESWRLAAFGTEPAAPGPRDPRVVDYRVEIGGGGRVATAFSLDELDNDRPARILWVGDLDRDGVPDLLTDLTQHYSSNRYVVFMSSLAGPGQIVAEAASFDRPGC